MYIIEIRECVSQNIGSYRHECYLPQTFDNRESAENFAKEVLYVEYDTDIDDYNEDGETENEDGETEYADFIYRVWNF